MSCYKHKTDISLHIHDTAGFISFKPYCHLSIFTDLRATLTIYTPRFRPSIRRLKPLYTYSPVNSIAKGTL